MFVNSQMQNMKRDMVLERLKELGIFESQLGQSIYDLDYDTLLYELVLAELKNVDVESRKQWF
jgi:hypothetical protein